jgi:hypothetical protein
MPQTQLIRKGWNIRFSPGIISSVVDGLSLRRILRKKFHLQRSQLRDITLT